MKIMSLNVSTETLVFGHQSKQNNKMYTSGSKKQTVKIRDQTVDLKETKNLYGRLMVLTRSNRDIDQKNAIGNYEFTLTARALFAPDGSMLPCTDKSKLIHNLEKLINKEESHEQTETLVANDQDDDNPKIAVVDGMVLVQKMTNKTGTLSTVKDLAQSFNENLTNLTAGFSEVILVFDTYKSEGENSREATTRKSSYTVPDRR